MILERIKEYIDFKKITVSAFEKSVGMSNASFGKSLKNGGAIGTDKLENILMIYTDINPVWLLTGEGFMLRDSKIPEVSTVGDVPNGVPISSEAVPFVYSSKDDDDFVSIPLVDVSVAAGCGGYENSSYLDVEDVLKMPASLVKGNGRYFCVRVKGESMAPTILDSSYVIVRLLERAEWCDMPEQHIYVVSDRDGRAYIKRIKNRLHEHGFITCMSDNPDKANYSNFNLQEDEINTILHAEWCFSAKMPNIHETYYKKVGELEDKYDVLQSRFEQLIKAINLKI